MSMQPVRPRYVAAIIERSDQHILVAVPSASEHSRQWMFPRGPATGKESAESAMRRLALEQLGLNIELVIGQPPLPFEIDGQGGEIRFFVCSVLGGQARPGPYAEVRWIPRTHLREYDFDHSSKTVVDWLLDS